MKMPKSLPAKIIIYACALAFGVLLGIALVRIAGASELNQVRPPNDPQAVVSETYSDGVRVLTSWIYTDGSGQIRYMEQDAAGVQVVDRPATMLEVESYQRQNVDIPLRTVILSELRACESEVTQPMTDVRLRECLQSVLHVVLESYDSDIILITE
jgi:hypothetical protein